ncbi:peptidyl-tRNA hydrolaseB1 [Acrasis kona]|uniref:Peptidyl-tRNA hydrolaseB1 n=1 Tax=Acrasis kona TaxID=1008807 RepID=A0AAW2YK63_9EUKA
MSLFRARDWWSTKCGYDEEFDKGCMVVGNVDNQIGSAQDSNDKIVTGSFSGLLRIYKPVKGKFSPNDLMLEQQLDQPVLQLALGKFIPGQPQHEALAVLMPRKLSVYTVSNAQNDSAPDGDTSKALSNITLILQYSHDLQRLSYNFCYGPFGGAVGRDSICIQSFDGQLAFYEQDHFIFARYITDSLVPGPICYFCHMQFKNWRLKHINFQVLTTSHGSNEKDANQQGGKRVQIDWSINVGEEIYELKVGRFSQFLSSSQTEIIAIGERTLFCLRDNGTIASQKRLDYFPSCSTLYNQTKDLNSKHNLIIASHNKSLMIYKDPKLIWASGTASIPVCVCTGKFGGIKGMIVLLDDEGNLSVNYLGSDPVNNPVPSMESKEVNYDELEKEHKKLQQFIRQTQVNGKTEPNDKLLIRAQVPLTIDHDGFDASEASPKRKVTVKLYLYFSGEPVHSE